MYFMRKTNLVLSKKYAKMKFPKKTAQKIENPMLTNFSEKKINKIDIAIKKTEIALTAIQIEFFCGAIKRN